MVQIWLSKMQDLYSKCTNIWIQLLLERDVGPACTAVQLDSSLILFDFAHLRPVENTKDDAWRIFVRLCPVGLSLQNLARNLPCQSGRLRSMKILPLFYYCFDAF